MRLVATVGAGDFTKCHTYKLKKNELKEPLSFLAAAKFYNIEDIVILGTEQTKESIRHILDENPNIKMVVIDSMEIETVFKKSIDHIVKDTILDLTQGFRHYPMLTLLASILSQTSANSIKDILYAQIDNEDCKPNRSSCSYTFVSIYKYLDIANMARVINTFNSTLIVIDQQIKDNEFRLLKETLESLSKELFANNFKEAKIKCEKGISIIDEIINKNSLSFIENHLKELKNEIKKVKELSKPKESHTLLNFAEYFLKKDIFLHSITFLYESMVAYLDEKIKNKNCDKTFDKRNHEARKATVYERRNCLKKSLKRCEYINAIQNCKEFSKMLRNIDKLRNISAHAFSYESHQKDIEREIKETIKKLKYRIAF